jgi:hypothetical protein
MPGKNYGIKSELSGCTSEGSLIDQKAIYALYYQLYDVIMGQTSSKSDSFKNVVRFLLSYSNGKSCCNLILLYCKGSVILAKF